MTFVSNSLDLIRRVFRRDQMTLPGGPDIYNQMDLSTQSMQNLGVAGPQADASGFLSESVQLDQDLNSRYADYEEMDSFPEISAAFDLFADDATIQDVLDGRSIWFEAPDQVVQEILENMLTKQLRSEEDLWDLARNLVKWGNCYREIVAIDKVGVVDMRDVHVPTVRRIQDPYGMLYGFVQDPSMGFAVSTDAFIQKLQAKSSVQNYMAQIAGSTYEDMVQVYEPWELIHFRMRGMNASDPYGISIAEAARYAWRRLTMMEDAMVLYKLCLRGDSRIWTTKGTTKIADLVVGDEVYSYAAPGVLKKSKVTFKKNNGTDTIYRVKSRHRDLYANATHPVLVETIECHGSGSPRTRRLDYVEVKDLIPGVHRFCTPARADEDCEPVVLKKPEVGFKARLKPEFRGRFTTADFGHRAQEMGISYPYLKMFLAGESELCSRAAIAAAEHVGIGLDALELREDWGGASNVSIPAVVDEDFAKWFGFMLGDGYVSDFEGGDGRRHRRVGFSAGDDQAMNQKYRVLFESYVGPTTFGGDQGLRHGYYQVASKEFSEFMLLNGFVPGCHNKVVPEWAYRASPSIKLAFLEGFADADGHWSAENVSKIRGRKRYARARIELCNRELTAGLRDLAMQTGLVVTRIYERFREGGRFIVGAKTPLPDRESFWFDIVYKPAPKSEKIFSVEKVGTDEIFDIGVDADEHNFIADGVVVHNTRSPQRYAFYVDIGDQPPNMAKKLLNQVKNDFKKSKSVDKNGKLNFRYNPLCLSLNAQIPVLSGGTKSIADLIKDHEAGTKNFVYSIDQATKAVVPGEVSWAGVTRKQAKVVRVVLDNCRSEVVTPDHKFMLRDGSYREAKDLAQGDGLMSLSSEFKNAATNSHKVVSVEEIEAVEDTGCITVDVWHNFAVDAGVFVKNSQDEDFFLPVRKGSRATEVDVLSGPEGQQTEDVEYFKNKLFAALKIPKSYLGGDDTVGRANLCLVPETKIPLLDGRTVTIQDLITEHEAGRENWVYSISPEGRMEPDRIVGAQWTRSQAEVVRVHLDNGEYIDATPDHQFMTRDGNYVVAADLKDGVSLMPFYERLSVGKIKVARVELLTERRDTCDIQVERNHNFATHAGVFVHNSQLDIRMSRSVMRVQRVIKNGFMQAARVDLSAKNIDPDLVEFNCMMNIPSGALEIAQIEVQTAKLDLAGRYRDAGFPEYFMWSNVLGLSDDEIVRYQEIRKKEQGGGGEPAPTQESAQRRVAKMIDEAKANPKMAAQMSKLMDELQEGKTETARRLRELKGLVGDIRQAMPRRRR